MCATASFSLRLALSIKLKGMLCVRSVNMNVNVYYCVSCISAIKWPNEKIALILSLGECADMPQVYDDDDE